jgi:hypothetical protein
MLDWIDWSNVESVCTLSRLINARGANAAGLKGFKNQ